MPNESIRLVQGKAALVIEPTLSSARLMWDGRELTKGCGLISIITTASGNRYYSDKVAWSITRSSQKEIEVELDWREIGSHERWRLTLQEEGGIAWVISFIPQKAVTIASHEVGLMVSLDYHAWVTSNEEGSFPAIGPQTTAWQNVTLKNFLVSAIGIRGIHGGNSVRPTIMFDFRRTNHHTEPQIRSSDASASLRALLALVKHPPSWGRGGINRAYECFSGQIHMFDTAAGLAKYRITSKQEDQKRWEEYRQAEKRKIHNLPGYMVFLWFRIKDHYRDRGFSYVVYRGVRYLFYAFRSFCDHPFGVFDFFISMWRWEKYLHNKQNTVELKSGKLGILLHLYRKSIDLYWSGTKLTDDLGFITIIGRKFLVLRRHYSNQAVWKVRAISPHQLSIRLFWPGLPLEQEWSISLSETEPALRWDVTIVPKRKLSLCEKEVGLLLSSDYASWISGYEEGEFPAIVATDHDWKDINIWNIASTSLGVRESSTNQEYKPGILVDFSPTKDETVVKVRNSDYRAHLRALLVQMNQFLSAPRYTPGKSYRIFSGTIRFVENDITMDRYILDCKKALYSQRLPHIEEKKNKRYLTALVKPVDVLLVNLPWHTDDKWGVRAGSRWPHMKHDMEDAYLPFPFFLAYASSVLLRHGARVRIIDAIADKIPNREFIDLVNELEPMLVIAEVSTPSLENDVALLRQIRKKNTKIAVCGLDFNIRQPAFLQKNECIDFTMIGEYEYIALELFTQLEKGGTLSAIPGLMYRENGAIHLNPPRALLDDLDDLPWPLREQLPMEQYMDAPGNIPTPSVQMLASRGCPFSCTFCAWPQLMYNSNRYRVRKAEAIVDEMEYLLKERNFKSVYFDDDTFNINKQNVLSICREITVRKLKVPWAVMARADTMDEDMLVQMKAAGLCAVKYGVESADQALLNNVRKGMDLKRAEQMIHITRQLGIKMHLTFTFGLPGETADTIKKTIDYAVALRPDTVQFSILTPYPGTEYYNQLDAKEYIITKDWSLYDGASRSVIRTEHLSPQDLEKAKEEALAQWRRYKRSRRSIISMPFNPELRYAFKNNVRNKGLAATLVKTAKYLCNIT